MISILPDDSVFVYDFHFDPKARFMDPLHHMEKWKIKKWKKKNSKQPD